MTLVTGMGVQELLLPPSQFWEAGKRLATFDDKKS